MSLKENFIKFMTSFDVFGKPVTFNYNGDTTYKTMIGASLTIVIKTFILVYACQQII